MKSFSMADLKTSMQNGVWATQGRNEAKLNQAFESSPCVVLLFSVNESRAFQGYAKMLSRTGEAKDVTWASADGTGGSWGGAMAIKWQTIYDLNFADTMHLHNPLNENKPIKISRDGQEMAPAVGFELCGIFDAGYAANPERSMKRRQVEEPVPSAKR